MNDDWRLRVELDDDGVARALTGRLGATGEAGEQQRTLTERIIVSRDDREVFAYAASREQAQAAAQEIRVLAADHGWSAAMKLERWHPVAERWEDPDEPLPQTAEEIEHEHGQRIDDERAESAAQAFAAFEVRVRLPSREAARQLAERLAGEGIPAAYRWEFLAVGAADEDAAQALAQRLRAEAPPGSEVHAQGSIGDVAREAPGVTPFSTPFSVFGGLGG